MLQKNPNQWIKFSQIGVQMAVTIGLMAYLGISLDEHFPFLAPWGALGLSLFGVGASLYHVIKQVAALSSDE